MKSNFMLNESMEDFVNSLQGKVSSLRNQYITFVSYCSDLIKSHAKNVSAELIQSKITHETPAKILKCLEFLENSYKTATKELGFTVSQKNSQEALNFAQKQISKIFKQNLTEKDSESKIGAIFLSLSEVICRSQFKATRKKNTGKPLDDKLNEAMQENLEARKKISILEIQISDLTREFPMKKSKKQVGIRGFASSRPKILSNDFGREGLNLASPAYSPLLYDSSKSTSVKYPSSMDNSFNMERLKKKLGSLAVLLEKFAGFASQIEKVVNCTPGLEGTMHRFNSVKKELTFALQGLISPESPNKHSDSESEKHYQIEIFSVKNENSAVKQELLQKNEEFAELELQMQGQMAEIKKIREMLSKNKQEFNKLEKENEELRLENIYSKSMIERHQKHNKILQDSLTLQEKKHGDMLILQAKYGEIMMGQKVTVRPGLKICKETDAEVNGTRRLCRNQVVFQGNVSIGKTNFGRNFKSSEMNKGDSEEFMNIHRNYSSLIVEKNKIEEDLNEEREKNTELQKENEELNSKLKDALEMCKILEDLFSRHDKEKRFEGGYMGIDYGKDISCFPIEDCKGTMREKDLKLLVKEKNRLEGKIFNLERELSEKTTEAFNGSEKIKSLMKLTEEYREDIRKSHGSISNFEAQIGQLQKKIRTFEGSNANLSEILTEKINECLVFEKKIKGLENIEKQWKLTKSILETSLYEGFSKQTFSFFELVQSVLDKFFSKFKVLQKKISVVKNIRPFPKTGKLSETISLSESLKLANIEISNLNSENHKLNIERKKLLETRDRLLSQCNTQSEELISYKQDADEKYLQQIEDRDYQVAILQGQLKKIQATEDSLNKILIESSEKYYVLCSSLEEKSKQIEELKSENSELKFRQSVMSSHSGGNYKEEIYTLKMKNIKLEQNIQEAKDSKLTADEISEIKNIHFLQISKVEEEKKVLEKKLKETEASLAKEKQSVHKAQDIFAKQLTGANMEIHNLQAKIVDLNEKILPRFASADEYNFIRTVTYEDQTWYLIYVKSENEYLWVKYLPLVPEESLMSFTQFNSSQDSLASVVNRLKKVLMSIESISVKLGFSQVLEVFNETRVIERKSDLENPNASKGKKFVFSEANRKASWEEDSANSSDVERSEKDKEINYKNDIIKKHEATISLLKQRLDQTGIELERFEQVKTLVTKFKLLNPILSVECSAILDMLISILKININQNKSHRKYY